MYFFMYVHVNNSECTAVKNGEVSVLRGNQIIGEKALFISVSL